MKEPVASTRVLKAFLASPGDLGDERAEVKAAVEYTNKLFEKRLRWKIELYGWEDTPPAYGRPQAAINKGVDECDLFIGMLWKRWGEATKGKYTSGFEEEFDRAVKRRRETGSPEIWLFLKDIDRAQLADPGQQLQAVLAFRDVQRASKQLFYKSFATVGAFRNLIREYLPQHLLEIASESFAATSPAQVPPSSAAESHRNAPGGKTSSKDYSSEVARLGQTIKALSESNDLRSANVSEETISDADAARFYLLAKSIVSGGYTFALAGVHEINLLYRLLSSADLSPLEKNLISRSLLGDAADTSPGWRLLGPRTRSQTLSLLTYYARYDDLAAVRTGALQVLRRAGLRVGSSRDDFASFLEPLIRDDKTRGDALAYFISIARLSDLKILEAVAANATDFTVTPLNRAKRLVLYRLRPDAALEFAMPEADLSDEEMDALSNARSRFSLGQLRRGLSHPSAKVRVIVARELFERKDLSREEARILEQDTDPELRELGFLQKVTQGEVVDIDALRAGPTLSLLNAKSIDVDKIVKAQFGRLSKEDLEQKIDFLSVDGSLAYEVSGDRFFQERETLIRADLDSGFEELERQAAARLQQRAHFRLIGGLDDSAILRFAHDSFIAAALRVLKKRGNPTDIQFARKYYQASAYYTKRAAIDLLARFGDETDVDLLIEAAKSTHGELKVLAAKAAIKNSPGLGGAAAKLIQTADIQCILVSLEELSSESFDDLEPLVSYLVDRKEPGLRLIYVSLVGERATRAKTLRFLEEYISRKIYYYNVVCWLDRLLFSPTVLKPSYRQQLKASVYGLISHRPAGSFLNL